MYHWNDWLDNQASHSSDLSAGLVNVLTDIVWKTTIEWHAGNVLCKAVRYCQGVVTFASTYMLVSLSVDRFDAVAWPMNFSRSAFRAKMLVGMAWGLSLIFSGPMLFINNETFLLDGSVQCWIYMPHKWHWKVYVTLLAVVLFILPAVIITTCYSIIVYVIWSKSHVLQPKRETFPFRKGTEANQIPRTSGRQASGKSSRGIIPQAKIRTVKMTLVIIIVFILCWSPYFLFDLLDVYGHVPNSQQRVAIATFIQSLAPLNSAANPIIYGVFSTRVCRNLSQTRKSTRRVSGHPSSLTGTDQTTNLTNGNQSKQLSSSSSDKDRRLSALPLVQRSLTEADSAVLMRNLHVRYVRPSGSVEDIIDGDCATEV